MQGDLHMANGEGDEDSLRLLPQSPPIFPYLGPAPPRKSTAHRYAGLLLTAMHRCLSRSCDHKLIDHPPQLRVLAVRQHTGV